MEPSGSITHWIGRLKAGDAAAAEALWRVTAGPMAGLARRRLRGAAGGRPLGGDEEDVALSAFGDLCRGAGGGAFPLLGGRDSLWALLATITRRKATALLRREGRQRRGGPPGERPDGPVPDSPDPRPGPESALLFAEECERLLASLPDPSLRAVALARLEGRTAEQIAESLGCVPRTVERKLRLIRDIWGREARGDEAPGE